MIKLGSSHKMYEQVHSEGARMVWLWYYRSNDVAEKLAGILSEKVLTRYAKGLPTSTILRNQLRKETDYLFQR